MSETDKKQYKRVIFAPHQSIFLEGDSGDTAYLISRGSAEIRKGVRGAHPERLNTVGKGDIIGEMALFDNRPRMASVVAITEVEALEIPRDALLRRLDGIDPVIRRLVYVLIWRVRAMADELMGRKQGQSNWGDWRKKESTPIKKTTAK